MYVAMGMGGRLAFLLAFPVAFAAAGLKDKQTAPQQRDCRDSRICVNFRSYRGSGKCV